MRSRPFPPAIADAIVQFRPVLAAWATAAGLDLADVRQEIAVAVLANEDPGRAVPRALRIRMVDAVWRPLDALPAAFALDDRDGLVAQEEEAIPDDATGIAEALAGGTERVAARCGVGRRAAQMRVRAQAARFEGCGDLFAGGVA